MELRAGRLPPSATPPCKKRDGSRSISAPTSLRDCSPKYGFVGGFNERVLEAAAATLKSSDLLFVLGSRGAALAFERGHKITWTAPMAIRLAGAADAVNRMTSELYVRKEVMFGRYRQGAASTIERRLLLPLDAATLIAKPARQVPLHNLPSQPLLEKLMSEYVFALLTEAAVESIASENAARFAAMESAHENVRKKVAGLRENERQVRQTEITSELLDLITGAEGTAGRSGTSRVDAAGSRNLVLLTLKALDGKISMPIKPFVGGAHIGI